MTEFFELTGTGYNIMTKKANQFGKFQVDLVLTDPAQIQEAEKLEMKYGLKLKDMIKFSQDGKLQEKGGVTAVTITKKYVEEGKYPCKSISTIKADSGEPIDDLISHGAKLTVRFKVFEYKGGKDNRGFEYPGGYSFQLEKVKVHEYTPYKSAA